MKLRIFVPASDNLAPDRALAWLLFDAKGGVLRAGATPAAEMPKAEDVELVLPASRVLFARLKLPKVNAATIRELLPYAVEDRLLAEPHNIHAVAGGRSAQGETIVAVVDRAWLSGLLQALDRSGISPRRASCESALLAGGAGDWNVVLGPDHGFLVDDDGVAVAFDRGTDLPLAIRVALDEASARNARPALVRVHTQDGAPLPDLARWSEQAGLPFGAGSQWEKLATIGFPRDAIDLLQGGFATRAGRALSFAGIPRAAVVLAAAIAVIHLGFTAWDTWRLSSERERLEAKRETIFRAAFPEAKAIVDPDLQMARNLGDLRRSRGLSSDDDFLVQATRAAREFPAGTAKALTYAQGRVEVQR
ncbi:type II secretion system protein GspL [Usitatibacter palustris]|uniref:General secretion pathway protein L n=1 Tax=Usitatibacter palustris TaxID=2732487 RepID=A0A6M4H821_9PROT|nr:type II secretion system protein GspL [Usitatibacter palustris]QJR15766.1 hypothetical protein DSM104440_02592 [Usitatibacter palustris]